MTGPIVTWEVCELCSVLESVGSRLTEKWIGRGYEAYAPGYNIAIPASAIDEFGKNK
jgi:hypothetical protein